MKGRIYFIVVFSFFVSSSGAIAENIAPFPSINQSPLIQIFGLPSPKEAFVLSPGQSEISFSLAHSSNYVNDISPHEEIILDGETTRLSFDGRLGLSKQWEVGIRIPFIIHGGGFLDHFIDDYHRTFGLPRGGREAAPANRLLYSYRRQGVNLLNFADSSSGIGDISILVSRQMYRKEEGTTKNGLTLNGSLKLPTGDSDALRGSGSYDLALWVSAQRSWVEALNSWSVYGSLGFLFLSDGDVLTAQQRNMVTFGTIGGGWGPYKWLILKLQTDFHTPFFKESDLDELSTFAMQLILGGTLIFSEKTSLDLGISEDLVVKTSPDVVFYLNLRHRF